jgi:hypothetical protein
MRRYGIADVDGFSADDDAVDQPLDQTPFLLERDVREARLYPLPKGGDRARQPCDLGWAIYVGLSLGHLGFQGLDVLF